MQAVVAYTSKTGFTKTYAEWISHDLGADLVETSDLTNEHIAGADVIIHGGGLRASRVGGLQTLLRHWPRLRTKHVVLWHTGANPGKAEAVEAVWNANLTPEQLEHTERFYLRGGFDYARLQGIDQIVMTIMRYILRRKKHPTDDDRGMLALFEHPTTELNRATIVPLVNHVRRIMP